MLVNFDVEQYVYLLDHKLMLMLMLMLMHDSLIDVIQILMVLVYVDDVLDDIHLNVDDV
jgi:hypothetical protein